MRIRFLDFLLRVAQPLPFVEWVSAGIAAAGLLTGIDGANRAERRANQLQDQQLALQGRQLDISERQLAMAEESWNRYLEIFDPIERGIAEDVAREPDIEGAINTARGDVTAAYDGARTRFDDRLAGYGINPGEGRFSQIAKGMELDRAKSEVGAINLARRQEEDKHFSRQLAAAGLGRNLPGQASAFMGAAGGGINAASANYGAAAGQQFGVAGQYGQDVAGSLYAAGRVANQFQQQPQQQAIPTQNVESGGWDSLPNDWANYVP